MKFYYRYLFISLFSLCALMDLKAQSDSELCDKYNKLATQLLEINPDSSLKCALLQVQYAKKINRDHEMITSHITLANSYARLFRFNEAIENYLIALKIVDDKKLNHRASILGNIGLIYMRQEKLDEAFKYFTMEYEAALVEGDFGAQFNCLSNMTDYYNSNLLPDSSISLLKRALHIAIEHKLDNKISLVYDNLANAYFTKAESSKNKADYAMVEQYADKALKMHMEEKDSVGIAYVNGLLGATYFNTGDYSKAEKYYKSAEEMCVRLHDILGLKTNYEEMSDMFAMEKKFNKAYDYRCKYDSINKLYLNGQSQQQVQELNTKYQTEKKEQENQLLTTKNNLSGEIIKRQRITVILIVTGLLGLFIASAFIFRSWKNQKKANVVIAQQKEEVEWQKQIVDVKNKEITDSILYAKRIQNAMLTSDGYIEKCVREYFCLYKPKDIVSGDFYWAYMSGKKFVMVTADCTGHGVPGAMMSMLGINLFNHLVAERNIPKPDAVLNDLRKEIIKALNSEESKEEAFDGMDCALLVIDFDTLNMAYASANSSFYILRGDQSIEYKADKMPIGKSPKENIPFTLKNIQLEKNDIIITLTDGYADQFGGKDGKKFKYKQLETLLKENNKVSLTEMKTVLDHSFETWKGKLEQVDDVCVIGIKI